MLWEIVLLLFLPGISTVDEDGYACIRHFNIYPPDDLNDPVYFPSYWNDSVPPIQFGLHQHCQWTVSVPEGLYATAIFYKDAVEATVYLNYANNPKTDKRTVKLKKDGLPIAGIPDHYLTTFQAETSVSFVAFGLKNESRNALLRQSAVYDGNSTNGSFMGNLFKLMMEGKEIITRESTLTIYTFGLYEEFNYTLFMVQDHSNDPGYLRYQGVNCISDSQCPITINARFGETAVVTADIYPEYITGFYSFPEYSTLNIYEGMISESTLVATLNETNYLSWLPMELKMTMRHYVVDSGNVTFSISRNPSIVNYNTMFDGRKAFAHSSFHGFLSDQQDIDETFTTANSQKLFFNYFVTAADFTGSQTYLTVTVFQEGITILSETYNSTNPPPQSIWSMQGDRFEVSYQTFGNLTRGCRVDFSTTLSGNNTVTPAPVPSTTKSTTPSTTQSTRTSTHPTSHFSSTTSPKITSAHPTSSTIMITTEMLTQSTKHYVFNNTTTKLSTVPTTPTTLLTTSTQKKLTSTQSTPQSSTNFPSTTSKTWSTASSTIRSTSSTRIFSTSTATTPTKRSTPTTTEMSELPTTASSSTSPPPTTSALTPKASTTTMTLHASSTTTVRTHTTTKSSSASCIILIITGSILLVIS